MRTEPGKRTLLIITPFARAWSQGERGGVADELHFVRGFRDAGWNVDVLAPRSADPDPYPGAEVHPYPDFFSATERWPVPVRRVLWPTLFHAVVAPRALRLVERLRPAFVLGLSHYTPLTTWLCRRRKSVPAGVKLSGVMDLVHTEWPVPKYVLKNFEQLVALRFSQDAWIVLDDGTDGERILRERGVDAGRIHFLPNGLDVEWADALPDRAGARASLGLEPDARVILFVARLVASKRADHAVRALPRVVREAGEAVRLVLVGDGPARGPCERLARELGVSGNVTFAGAVDHEQIPHYMAASDVFVSTSNLTNAAIPTCEAMVCALPPVVYNVGTTAHTVVHEQTGLCVPDGDVDALGAALVRILCDNPLRAGLGRAAAALARERFVSWNERIARERAIIESLALPGR